MACFGPLFVLARGGTFRRFRFRGGRGRCLGGFGDYLTGLERSGEVLGPVAVRAAQDSYANVRLDAGRLAGEGGVHGAGAGDLWRSRSASLKEQFLKKTKRTKKTSIFKLINFGHVRGSVPEDTNPINAIEFRIERVTTSRGSARSVCTSIHFSFIGAFPWS